MKKITALAMAGTALVSSMAITSAAGAATNHPGAKAAHAHHLGRRVLAVESIAQSGALPTSFSCAKAPVVQAHLSAASARLTTRLAEAGSKEQAAISAGNTAKAARIAFRVQEGNVLKSDLSKVGVLITAKCG